MHRLTSSQNDFKYAQTIVFYTLAKIKNLFNAKVYTKMKGENHISWLELQELIRKIFEEIITLFFSRIHRLTISYEISSLQPRQ